MNACLCGTDAAHGMVGVIRCAAHGDVILRAPAENGITGLTPATVEGCCFYVEYERANG